MSLVIAARSFVSLLVGERSGLGPGLSVRPVFAVAIASGSPPVLEPVRVVGEEATVRVFLAKFDRVEREFDLLALPGIMAKPIRRYSSSILLSWGSATDSWVSAFSKNVG